MQPSPLMPPQDDTGTGLDAADHLAGTFRASGPAVAYYTAIRTRSPLAERVLARLAAPELAYDDLLRLARDGASQAQAALDGDFLCALAGTLYARGEFTDSLALYRLADTVLNGAIPKEHQAQYARCSLTATGTTADLLDRFADISNVERKGLVADETHPSRGGDEATWLEHFKTLTGIDDLYFSDDVSLPYFDRLRAAPAPAVRRPSKISVVMTCYKPGPELFTAVNSVIAQSWTNWELVLVDDASGDDFRPVLAEAASLDPRIKVIRMPRNTGTYGARNRAMLECHGQFITGVDSDDWVHPRWLEIQVAPLLRNRRLVMSVASEIRAHANLMVTNSGRPIRGPRSTSIMFRAKPVRERLGFYDSVRKGADTEFRMRFLAAFGSQAVKRVTHKVLYLVRLGDETLTSSEFGVGWMHPARFAYQSAQIAWHDEIRAGDADPFMSAADPRRRFLAPDRIRSRHPDDKRFDMVFVADCRFLEDSQSAMLEKAASARSKGASVGVLHLEALQRPQLNSRPLHPEIMKALQFNDISFVNSTDEVATEQLVVSDASLWEERRPEYGVQSFQNIEIWDTVMEPLVPAAPKPPAARPEPVPVQPRPRKPRRPMHTFAPHALGFLALCAVLTAAGLVWDLPGVAPLGVFWFSAATLFGLILLATRRGYGKLMTLVDRNTST